MAASVADVERFLQEYEDFLVDPRKHGRPFNLLSLFGLASDEVAHSRFLAWLLDAHAPHDAGRGFLEALARAAGIELPPGLGSLYRVRTEVAGENARVDIVVYRRGVFLLFIENKVNAGEGDEQLWREYQDLQAMAGRLGVPREHRHAVFLTPGGRRPITDDPAHWIRLAYPRLVAEIRAVISRMPDAKARHIVGDWADTMAGLEGQAAMDSLSEELIMLARNWPVIERLYKADIRLRGELKDLLRSLQPELERQPWWDQGWVFMSDRDGVYITKERWKRGDTYVIWVGIEYFTVEGLFGEEGPPRVYVWVAAPFPRVTADLAETLTTRAGKPDEKAGGQRGYIVQFRKGVTLADDFAGYWTALRTDLLEFFAFYAGQLDQRDDAITRAIAGG